MKASFTDFINNNSNYIKFQNNSEAKFIFEQILSKDENIIAMIDVSELGKPALSACVLEVEEFYDNSATKEFDLTNGFTKQGLGRMVKTILEPFGYEVCGQKDMPKSLGTKYVTSASVYKLTGKQKLKIVKTIVEC